MINSSSEHLLAQYDRVESVIKEYEGFIFTGFRRMLNPISYASAVLALFLEVYKKHDGNLTDEDRTQAQMRAVLSRLYKPEERTSEFFEIAFSRHALHHLSE